MTGSKSILLIDDDKISNYLVSLLLSDPDNTYPFHIAGNAVEALVYLQDLNKSTRVLVLLDIHMPILDGFEFIGHLENKGGIDLKLLDFVIISSSIAQKDFDKAKSYNITKFLLKPIKKENLQAIIKEFELV